MRHFSPCPLPPPLSPWWGRFFFPGAPSIWPAGERDDCYILSGFDKGFSKTRFGIVSNRPCQPQRRGDRPSRDTLSNDDFSATAFAKRTYDERLVDHEK